MDVMLNLPVLIIMIPISAALLNLVVSRFAKAFSKWFIIASLFAACACGVALFFQVLQTEGQVIHYAVGMWEAPIGIEFVIDPLNAFLAILITFIASCAALFAKSFIRNHDWVNTGGYYALMAMLCVGLTGMTLTGDVFNLYVFLEIASLSCYGLVALGGDRAVLASFRYLLIGTIGASFYLVAIGLLYSMTGSLNMADIGVLMQDNMNNPLMFLVCVCLICAFGIKMAIFPFHVWQPDAYSFSHPGAAPLISGAMSKVPAFAMIRFFFFIFGWDHIITSNALTIIAVIGAIGMLYGSFIALAQKDFRRMLAYSSIAQLGYVALGIGLANYYGITGSYLHIINHLFMKGGLFFVIGGIQYRYGIVNIDQMGQLHKKMPLTCFTLVIGALSMVGIPPTGGFFSKWYLLLGSVDAGAYIYIAVLIVSSLLNAIYFLRVLEKVFISKDPGREEKITAEEKGPFELPLNMLIPIVLFGIGILVLGFANGYIVNNIVQFPLEGVL